MLLYALFTLPNATTTFEGISPYSTSLFDQFLPVLYIIVGFLIGGMLLSVVIRSIMRGAKKVLIVKGGRRRGRR